MLKTIRVLTILSSLTLLIMLLASPVMAQEEMSPCVRLEVTLGPGGQYIFLLANLDQLLNWDFMSLKDSIEVRVGEPNSIVAMNVLLSPNTIYLLVAENAEVGAANFDEANVLGLDSDLIIIATGDSSGRISDYNACVGAATDGRINLFDQQMLAALYSASNGGYDIWAIDPATSQGTFNYNVTRAQVDEALASADSSGQAQIIASGTTSTLYALGNGECQLNSPNASGEMQEYIFDCR